MPTKRGFLNVQYDAQGKEILTTARDNGKGDSVTDVELKGIIQTKTELVDSLTDFKGKISGDLNSNPSIAKFSQTATLYATTKDFGTNEFNSTHAPQLGNRDTTTQAAWTTAGQYFQSTFNLDVLTARKKAEGNNSLTVAQLKANTPELVIEYFGTGEGDNNGVKGFGMVVSIWNNRTSSYEVLTDNTDSYTRLTKSITTNVADYIDTNGRVFIYSRGKYPAGAIAGLMTFQYVSANPKYGQSVTVEAQITNNGLGTEDKVLFGKIKDIEDKLDLVLNAKTTIKTKSFNDDYALNIHHMEEFKQVMKERALQQIVPVAMVGDSITEGGSTTDFLVNGYASITRDVLKSKYLGAGAGFISAWRRKTAAPTYAWARTGTWADGLGYSNLSAGATGTISITGTGFRLLYVKGSVVGKFTVTVDGGTPVEINANQATSDYKAEYVVNGLTSGSHTIVVTNNDAAKPMYLMGIIETERTNGLRLDNFGNWGKNVYLMDDFAYFSLITRENPLLTVLALTANDFEGQTNLYTYKKNIKKLIDDVKTKGNYMVLFANGLRQTTKTVDQVYYELALRELALENDIGFISWNEKYKNDYSNISSLSPTIMTDTVHPNDLGHKDMAQILLKHLF